jgi:hypothetical protein
MWQVLSRFWRHALKLVPFLQTTDARAKQDTGSSDQQQHLAPDLFSHLSLNSPEQNWKFHVPLRAATLPDGTKTLGLVMRRKVDGKWQYRKPTLEEEDDYVSRDAW